MIKYRTRWDYEIQPFEVVKETAKFVTYLEPGIFIEKTIERKEAKRSDYTNWHDTWAEARGFLMNKNMVKMGDIARELEEARKVQTALLLLEPPA